MRRMTSPLENTMVAQVALSNMRQGYGEPIRSFHGRLKGQADTCKYEMTCTKVGCDQVNGFTEEILHDVIARGIADQEIQLDLFGEKNQDMSLKDMIEYIRNQGVWKALDSCLTLRAQTQSVACIDGGNSKTRPHQRGHQARETKDQAWRDMHLLLRGRPRQNASVAHQTRQVPRVSQDVPEVWTPESVTSYAHFPSEVENYEGILILGAAIVRFTSNCAAPEGWRHT